MLFFPSSSEFIKIGLHSCQKGGPFSDRRTSDMTDEQRQQIINLRAAGNGYKKISHILGLSENTVKSFCQRRKVGGLVIQPDAGIAGKGSFRILGKI